MQALNHRLHFGCLIGSAEQVTKAIHEGADVNSLGLHGQLTPLLTAINSGYSEIVKILLENGANTELSCDGYTPLLLACSAGFTDIAHLLIEHKAHIETCDNEGNTPLLQAALEGHMNTVKYLLIMGANRQAVNYNHESAIELAQKNGHAELANFLKLYDKC